MLISSFRDNLINTKKIEYNTASINNNYRATNNLNSDKFIKNSSPDILLQRNGNITKIISFCGDAEVLSLEQHISTLSTYDYPAIKMGLGGVSQFQDNIENIDVKKIRNTPELIFKVDEENNDIGLVFKENGQQIGFIHYEILNYLYEDIKENPDDFKARLTKVIKFDDMNYIGLRADLFYVGKDTERINKKFKEILDDDECKPITFAKAEPKSPEQIMELVLKYEKQLNGTEAENNLKKSIDAIVSEIKNESNKNILLLGHQSPDGDTIGCVLAMKHAIELMKADKNIDCAIDDRIPLLFSYLPGIKEIKSPSVDLIMKNIDDKIDELKSNDTDAKELETFINIKETLEKTFKPLDENKKYDLVILMDIPTQEKLGPNFSKYIDKNNTKIIIIDHHPKSKNNWNDFLNSANIKENDNRFFSLIADRVPAATELVAVVIGKMLPWINNPEDQTEDVSNIAKPLLTGLHTDTSNYSRSANLNLEDKKLEKWNRPKYDPLSLAKWFTVLTDHTITTNYIEANLYEHNKFLNQFNFSDITSNKQFNKDLGLGYVKVSFEDAYKLWLTMAEINPEIAETDIYSALKMSKEIKKMKRKHPSYDPDYSKYEQSKIVYLIYQNAKKDKLDMSLKKANADKFVFSFRSAHGTNHAALLAGLFGGGGHGAAAGGRLSAPELNFDTKLQVHIDGNKINDPAIILNALENNFKIINPSNDESEKSLVFKKISVTVSPDQNKGKTVTDLVEDVVKEIRIKQDKEENNNEEIKLPISA
jgi:nanoRNase/pAp phosphatase (c-di-AMP/oligoRNAs hydrolase)